MVFSPFISLFEKGTTAVKYKLGVLFLELTLKSLLTEKHEVISSKPYLIGLYFRGCFPAVFGCSFLNCADLF